MTSKIDFEQLVPDPKPIPDTPQCDDITGKRWNAGLRQYETRRCVQKSAYRIGGKHYCKRHAAKAALAYLRLLGLE